jgi:cytochrome c-type biogenesis protein CcsB
LANAVYLYRRLKFTLQPEGAENFAQTLVAFEQDLGPARQAAKASQDDKDFDKAAIEKLAMPLREFQTMADFGYPLIVPPQDPQLSRDGWKNLGKSVLDSAPSGQISPAVNYLVTMATAYEQDQPGAFNQAVAAYGKWLEDHHFEKAVRKGSAEFYYNDVKAFLHAMIIYLFAFVLAGLTLVFFTLMPNLAEALRRSSFYLIILAGAVHTFGLIFRMVLEGRPPVTNLYSSAIFIGWGTMVLGIIIERIYRVGIGCLVAALAGFVTLLIAHNLALGGDTMQMLQAVLDTNFWLATHVVVVTLGYASTFFAGLLAIIYIFLGVFTPLLKQKLAPAGASPGRTGSGTAKAVPATAPQLDIGKALSKMVYGIVCFATLFSFTGTVLGGIWADQSWGRFWGWDPKENGALLIVIWNAIILHARWGGLVRDRGIMNLAVLGNMVTSFSWFGVNMLGIGLHSYGFMDAAFKWLMLFLASQVTIIGVGLLPLHLWRSFRAIAPPALPPNLSGGTHLPKPATT